MHALWAAGRAHTRSSAGAALKSDAKDDLRRWAGPEPCELRGTVAARLRRAQRDGVPGPARSRAWQRCKADPSHLARGVRAVVPIGPRVDTDRHRSWRHGGGDAAEYSGDGRGALRHSDGRRGAECAEHAARCGLDRLHAGARRSEDHHCRPRVRPDRACGDRAAGAIAAGDRCRRSGLRGSGSAGGKCCLRSIPRDRCVGFFMAAADRRVERDRAQLHVGYHGQSQGSRVLAPWRLHECRVERAGLGDAAPSCLPLDAADVSLQRLVLPVDGRCNGGHARMPASRRGGGRVRRHPHPSRHALLRRPDRALDAGQRAGRTEERHQPPRQRDGRCGRSPGGDDRRHGPDGFRPDACLRADRGLWTGDGLRQAVRVGCARCWRAGFTERPAGRALHASRRTWQCSIRRPCSRCHGTARRSAR